MFSDSLTEVLNMFVLKQKYESSQSLKEIFQRIIDPDFLKFLQYGSEVHRKKGQSVKRGLIF